MNKRLYVGNLPYQVDDAALEALFSQAGAVESVRVMRDTETGRARGFAFVEMVTEQDSDAIRDLIVVSRTCVDAIQGLQDNMKSLEDVHRRGAERHDREMAELRELYKELEYKLNALIDRIIRGDKPQ